MPKAPHTSAQSQHVSAKVYSSLAERAQRSGLAVRSLHVGDSYLDPPDVARAERQLLSEHPGMHAYGAVQGETLLRNAFVEKANRRHGISIDPAHVQITAGATSGFNVVAQSILEPGDEVILLSPFWPLIRGIFATQSAVVKEVPFYTRLQEPGFDPEAVIEAAITPRTAAIYLNSPNNPTGAVLAPEVLQTIIRIAQRHSLWILSDEAYEDIYFGDHPSRSLWTLPDAAERTITCHTISKSYAMAGTRVGFVHGPAEVMKTVIGMQTFLTYSAPRPMQFAAAKILASGDEWLVQLRSNYRRAAQTASQQMGLPMPQGSTFLFFQAPGQAANSAAFLEACADRGVLLSPGSSSGSAYAGWARMCFTAVDYDSLVDALQRIKPLMK